MLIVLSRVKNPGGTLLNVWFPVAGVQRVSTEGQAAHIRENIASADGGVLARKSATFFVSIGFPHSFARRVLAVPGPTI